MTQAALAAAAGTRERNIIRWENDQHEPRFEHVAAIARATSRDIDYFLSAVGDAADDEEDDPVNALMLAVRRVVQIEIANAKEEVA